LVRLRQRASAGCREWAPAGCKGRNFATLHRRRRLTCACTRRTN